MSLNQDYHRSATGFWRTYSSSSQEIRSCTQSGNTHRGEWDKGKTGGVSLHQGEIFSMDLKPGENATKTKSAPKAKGRWD